MSDLGTVSVELLNIERSVGDSLRAENDGLRAEIEHLRSLLKEYEYHAAPLRASIERLLDALATIAQSTPQNLDAEMLRVIARAALAKEG